MSYIQKSGSSLFVGLHYDTTPFHVRFGAMVSKMSKHAKYPVLQSDGTWKAMPLEQYSREGAKSLPRVLLASSCPNQLFCFFVILFTPFPPG